MYFGSLACQEAARPAEMGRGPLTPTTRGLRPVRRSGGSRTVRSPARSFFGICSCHWSAGHERRSSCCGGQRRWWHRSSPACLSARLADALPGWKGSRLIFHLLESAQSLPEIPPGQVRFLDPDSLDRLPVPLELLNELKTGAEHSPISATLVQGQPVSFCYACAMTESFWDIAIDTLPEHRMKGYAALCVTHLIRYMGTQGKQPVWQALEGNPASWRLAQKLGFIPVDEMVLFEPPGQE